MSTVAEVKQFLQPYVDDHDDLALVGRAVLIKPVHHLICGFFLDRTSVPTLLNPFWFVSLTYAPWGVRGFSWTGYDLVRHKNLEDERAPADIFQGMDAALSELRGISDRCSAFGIKLNAYRKLENFPRYRGLVAAAEGDFRSALEDLSKYTAGEEGRIKRERDFIEKHTRPGGRPRQRQMMILERITKNLEATNALIALLEKNDRPGVAALLCKWEHNNAKVWKIEHLWEPTPFPFEERA